MKKLILCLSTLFLFSCGNQPKEQNKENKEASAESKGSDGAHYKIVYLNKYYSDYITAVKKDYVNKRKIYDDVILDALKKEYFLKSEYRSFFEDAFSYFVPDTVGLEHAINGVKSNKKEIDERIAKAVNMVQKDFKNDSITFYIQPPGITGSEMLRKMGGVTGLTVGSKQVLLTIDTDVDSWDEALEYAAAREYYRANWTKDNYDSTYKWTLLRHLVFEGKADSYIHNIYPTCKAPWANALSNMDKSKLWKKIKPRLDAKNTFYVTEIMFGSNNYPVWGGYTLGYTLLQNVLEKNPEMKLAEWTKMSAEEILEKSDWK